VEEWEEPLHPGSLGATLPHFLPHCNPFRTFSPTWPHRTIHFTRGAIAHEDWLSRAPGLQAPLRCALLQPLFRRERDEYLSLPARVRSLAPCAAGPEPQRLRSLTMPTLSRPRPSRAAAASLAAVLACGLAGCGGSKEPGLGPDPARLVPGSAPLYLGAVVRPTGSLEEHARSAGRALTGEPNPYAGLLGVIRTPGSPALDFERDLAPWLGGRAGIFVSAAGGEYERVLSMFRTGVLGGGSGGGAAFPFAGAKAQGAVVLDSTDEDKARAFVATQARRAGARPTAYRGVSYELAGDGTALGVVNGAVVLGSDAGVRAVIDTARGAASLARSPAYARLGALAPAEPLAHLFVGASAASSATRASAPASVSDLLGALAGSSPANVSLLPAQASLALDVDTLASAGGARGGLAAADPSAASALAELPGDAFLALGIGSGSARLGAYARAIRDVAALGGPPSGEAAASGISVSGLLGAILAPWGALTQDTAQARRDFQSWIGPAAIFASGSGLLDLRAALVISSSDASASRAAVAKLGARLRHEGGVVQPVSIPGTDAAAEVRLEQLPIALDIAAGRDSLGQAKFVIGLGEASVTTALHPTSTLGAVAAGATAEAALGEGIKPSAILQVPTLLSVLEGVGLTEDATIAPLLPYLRALSSVYAGGRDLGGGAQRLRVVVGLREGG
jgi:hypothetical protein